MKETGGFKSTTCKSVIVKSAGQAKCIFGSHCKILIRLVVLTVTAIRGIGKENNSAQPMKTETMSLLTTVDKIMMRNLDSFYKGSCKPNNCVRSKKRNHASRRILNEVKPFGG